jgi:outer membrane immunogenic protein
MMGRYSLVLPAAAAVALTASQLASAADLGRPPPPPAPAYFPAPAYNWTGCHIGGDVGGAWIRDENTETVTATGQPSPFSPVDTATPSGVKLGGYLGCDYQFANPVVVGIEGDAEWANIRGGTVSYPNTDIPFLLPADTYETQAHFEASVRGRLGYAFQNWLFYATGGLAWANIKEIYNSAFLLTSETFSNTQTGWTVGAGIEYAFAPNWVGRIEYRYADFGTLTNLPVITFSGFTESHKITENTVRAGIAYKFW